MGNSFSSQDRYDHFDTAPRYFCLSDAPEKGEKRRREQTEVLSFRASKTQRIQGFFERRVPRSPNVFESAPL